MNKMFSKFYFVIMLLLSCYCSGQKGGVHFEKSCWHDEKEFFIQGFYSKVYNEKSDSIFELKNDCDYSARVITDTFRFVSYFSEDSLTVFSGSVVFEDSVQNKYEQVFWKEGKISKKIVMDCRVWGCYSEYCYRYGKNIYAFGVQNYQLVLSRSRDRYFYTRPLLNREFPLSLYRNGEKIFNFSLEDIRYDLNKLDIGDYEVVYYGFNNPLTLCVRIVE